MWPCMHAGVNKPMHHVVVVLHATADGCLQQLWDEGHWPAVFCWELLHHCNALFELCRTSTRIRYGVPRTLFSLCKQRGHVIVLNIVVGIVYGTFVKCRGKQLSTIHRVRHASSDTFPAQCLSFVCPFFFIVMLRAHGVVVSHPLSMREALGSIPSVSISPHSNHEVCSPLSCTFTTSTVDVALCPPVHVHADSTSSVVSVSRSVGLHFKVSLYGIAMYATSPVPRVPGLKLRDRELNPGLPRDRRKY